MLGGTLVIMTGNQIVGAYPTTEETQAADGATVKSDLDGQVAKIASGQTLTVLGQTSAAGSAPSGSGAGPRPIRCGATGVS